MMSSNEVSKVTDLAPNFGSVLVRKGTPLIISGEIQVKVKYDSIWPDFLTKKTIP